MRLLLVLVSCSLLAGISVATGADLPKTTSPGAPEFVLQSRMVRPEPFRESRLQLNPVGDENVIVSKKSPNGTTFATGVAGSTRRAKTTSP